MVFLIVILMVFLIADVLEVLCWSFFSVKLQAESLELYKKETPTQLQNIFFIEQLLRLLQWLPSENFNKEDYEELPEHKAMKNCDKEFLNRRFALAIVPLIWTILFLLRSFKLTSDIYTLFYEKTGFFTKRNIWNITVQ